jgi:hypothetical protein
MVCDVHRTDGHPAVLPAVVEAISLKSSQWRQPARRPGSIIASSIFGAIVLILMVMQGPSLWAQSSNAEMSGVVTDTSGAVVAGAEIKALNTATNVTYSAVSNGSGLYLLSELLLGPYALSVSAPGFGTVKHSGLVLSTGAHLSQNFTLKPGAVEESVTVTGAQTLISSDEASSLRAWPHVGHRSPGGGATRARRSCGRMVPGGHFDLESAWHAGAGPGGQRWQSGPRRSLRWSFANKNYKRSGASYDNALVVNGAYVNSSGQGVLNAIAFERTPDFSFANSPVFFSNLRNPGVFTTDASILKKFYLSDNKARFLEARLEALNILNHPVFGNIVADPDSPTFGGINGKTGQRVMQIGVRFFF